MMDALVLTFILQLQKISTLQRKRFFEDLAHVLELMQNPKNSACKSLGEKKKTGS